ncbi:hypothetical protein P5V15_007554 [Pogonomyrmex californicus]
MSWVPTDSYHLTHPELLSDYQLREILKMRCIRTYEFEKMSRSELLQMYNRMALPLPQRQHNIANSDNNRQDNSRQFNCNSLAAGSNKTKRNESPQMDKVNFLENKKIRLYSPPKESNGIYKRVPEGESEDLSKGKRQKTT